MRLAEPTRWLGPEHFAVDVACAARDLIGRMLRVGSGSDAVLGIIVETEAYGGADDAASHAAFKPNGRAAIMAGEPGLIYVYAAYGMYPCVNIVTGPVGSPAAVLVRGVWVVGDRQPTLGPGRTARRMGITLDDQGERVGAGRFNISEERIDVPVQQTTRIGIRRGVELPWRFVADFRSVSARA